MEKKILQRHTYTGHLTEAHLVSSDIKKDLYTIKNEQVKSYCKEFENVNNFMAHKVSQSPEPNNLKFETNPELKKQFIEHDTKITEIHKSAKAHFNLLKTEFKNHPDKDCSNTLQDFMYINKVLLKHIDTMVDIFF